MPPGPSMSVPQVRAAGSRASANRFQVRLAPEEGLEAGRLLGMEVFGTGFARPVLV